MQWQEIKNQLHKEYLFSNPTQVEEFSTESKKLFSSLGHDPEQTLTNSTSMELFLTTHSAGNKVTEKDWQLAKALDTLFYSSAGSVPTYLLNDPRANPVWERLFIRQKANLENKIHPLFWAGMRALAFSASAIPNLEQVNGQMLKISDFEMEKTQIQYAGDKEWFEFLSKRRIMVTNYIRTEKDLDYTPLPDIFHDLFGHLPWLAHKPIADLAEKFGQIYLAGITELQRFMTERLWWNAMEFGLMDVGGKKLIIGAGLASSFGECNHAMQSNAVYIDFAETLMPKFDRSPHVYHKHFFVFKSFEQISKALDWILSHPKG